LREACRRLGVLTLEGAIVVSSCKPCPLCQSAAVLAGVERIVYAAPKELAARYVSQLVVVTTEPSNWRTDGGGLVDSGLVGEYHDLDAVAEL
jgi:tRNA(Arg) A34 adenosine deaminase TadA